MKLEKRNIDTFETNLGKIAFSLTSLSNSRLNKEDKSILIETNGHLIEIIAFDDIKKWTKDTNPIETAFGWIVRILKTNDLKEKISIECSLSPINEEITSDIDTGEFLDSLCIENETDVISIGTEDGEMMKYRSEKEDWMPLRFKNLLGYQSNSEFSFTSYLKFGLQTNLPELVKGEKVYFHYLIATDKRRKSKEYPKEDDISTYLAVDFPKRTLIERLKIKEKITKC
tara:strand:- start:1791 stop:2474 length:684 start_codon:yes stop_codon:yes gene_type:complete